MEISVIIPTFKPKDYLWECLDSLKNQDIEKEKYEVLIILNGEKEPYYSDILSYINKNQLSNFKLNYTNLAGVSNARNIGLDISQGENIVFIDDDDYISRNYLRALNDKVEENTIVVTNNLMFGSLSKLKVKNNIEFIEDNYSNDIIKNKRNFDVVSRKIIPKNIIGITRFRQELKNSEDTVFMIEISKNIKAIKTTSKNVIYYRRVRENSAHFRKKSKSKMIINYLIQSKYMLIFLMKKGYNKKLLIGRLLYLIKGILSLIKGILKKLLALE